MAGSFMDLAFAEARAAAAAGEVPVGCVIVRGGDVLARTRNRTLAERDPTAHAEMLAIRQAAAAIGSERLVDCDVHVTLEPCTMCVGAMLSARIDRLVWGAPSPKAGALGGLLDVTSAAHNHRFAHTGGVEAEASAELLAHFFAALRKVDGDV